MTVKRIEVGTRMSQCVVHGNTVYTAGQVARNAPGGSVADQTKDILGLIDGLLAEAGTDKSKLLSANIWLSDIGSFNEMNAVWDAWISPGNAPCRACVESKLAAPQYTVEIMVIAALD
ncbi:MAG: RidA family protein [Pseudomonadota bacterium]